MGGNQNRSLSSDINRAQIRAQINPKIIQNNRKLLKKQTMNCQEEEEFVTKLSNDGVKMQDYLDEDKYQWFINCGICKTQYSQHFKPALLSCGHYICKTCASLHRCAAPKCFIQKNFGVVQQQYWPYNKFSTPSFAQYRFILVNQGKYVPVQNLLPGNDTFQKLQNIYPELFLNITTKDLIITINGKTFPYLKYQKKTFNEFKNQNGNAIFYTKQIGKERFCNRICRYRRTDGGFD